MVIDGHQELLQAHARGDHQDRPATFFDGRLGDARQHRDHSVADLGGGLSPILFLKSSGKDVLGIQPVEGVLHMNGDVPAVGCLGRNEVLKTHGSADLIQSGALVPALETAEIILTQVGVHTHGQVPVA